MYAIRGATTVQENSKSAIEQAAKELIVAIEEANKLAFEGTKNVVSIIISSTADLTAFYPAAAVRSCGYDNVPLFSAQEPNIDGAISMCIRMLVHVEGKNDNVRHIYLHGAAALRPDLAKDRG